MAEGPALPGLAQLEATPEILRALMGDLTEDDATWKPAPDRWSVAEVLEHLSHEEAHVYRLRIDQVMEQDGAAWEPYDQNALSAAGQYSGRDPEDSFDHFEEQRANNLEYLRDLPAGAEARTGMHPELGRITLAELLNEWACHDLGHIRQIIEIIRARRYYPHIGAFRKYYAVNP